MSIKIDGSAFITFGAVKWLHGVGASLVQLDWDGTVLLATAPAGTDQPGLRRAQALAAGNRVGHVITREILRANLNGQAAVARLFGSDETAELILRLAGERASLAYDAMEAARPYVDGWLAAWLSVARFSKRDFYMKATAQSG